MKESDFAERGIINFTPREVRKTGARLEDVDVETMEMAQAFRTRIARRVKLLSNGLTSGHHRCVLHPQGKAWDFWLNPKDGFINPNEVYETLLAVGFHGVGIYWNTIIFTFHGDRRTYFKGWTGWKDGPKKRSWIYRPIIPILIKRNGIIPDLSAPDCVEAWWRGQLA